MSYNPGMKLLFTSDLHLGRRLGRYDAAEDQAYMIDALIRHLDEADGIIIAGDVYDRSQPPGWAVMLFDRLLSAVAEKGRKAYIIAGNHDSSERLSVGRLPLASSGIHISAPVMQNRACYERIDEEDEYGSISLFILPYIRPQDLWDNPEYPGVHPSTHDEAFSIIAERMAGERSGRSVLITHQMAAGSERSESEDIFAGGLDAVSASNFSPFSFTAIGHLHRRQHPAGGVLYPGSPLMYSFGEEHDEKGFTLLSITGSGVDESFIPFRPLRKLCTITGAFEEVLGNGEEARSDDYIRIILTDPCDAGERVMKLYSVYPHLVSISYSNQRTALSDEDVSRLEELEGSSPEEIASAFFLRQNGRELSDEEGRYLLRTIGRIWGGGA